MQGITNVHEPKTNSFEQIMDIDSFSQVDPGDIRTQAGGLFVHKDNGGKFFLKPCFIGIPEPNNINQYFVLDSSSIMALFMGKIFQLLMKDRSPNHFVIKGWSTNALKVSIASKFLDNFRTFLDVGIKREYVKIENAKGIHRYLASTIILSNYDVNIANFGLIQEAEDSDRIAGIDLDASLSDCFNSFQGYFSRLKYNAQFSSEFQVWGEKIDLNEVHNKLKNKVNFKKLLDKLDNACVLIEKNLADIELDLKTQEGVLLKLLHPYFDWYMNVHNKIVFQKNSSVFHNSVFCEYDKQGKIIKFSDGKNLAEKILSILVKHIEIVRKSSKTLNIAAEICKNKAKNCINLIDRYVKSYDEKDIQVGEASHFLNWLEVNKEISTELISELKNKYGVSTTNLQKASTIAQPSVVGAANNPQTTTPTPPQQIKSTNSAPQQPVTGNAPTFQQPTVISSNPQPTITTPPQQIQSTNGGSQPITGNAIPSQQTLISNGMNNNSSQPHLDNTKHNLPQEHFLGISPRGWVIIGVAAIACALALYLLAPLILSAATVGVGTKLGFGAAGAVVGGVLTGIAINKCCSGATLPNYTN